MDKNQKGSKKILSHESIYKIMQWLPLIVAAIFFLKNIGQGIVAMATIGVCLVAYIGVLIIVKVRKFPLYVKEYVLAVALPILVFMISLNSGVSYSDDFSLFLAVMALTGLYLEPQFTKMQIILIDILLVIMYIMHPEKVESTSQYILCAVVFTFAACLFQQVIKRGRAFIEISQERAEESERLLESIRAMGMELQRDFAYSSAKIDASTQGLQEGSVSITQGSGEVSDSCNIVHNKIKETEKQIVLLNTEVRNFEDALGENRNNVNIMSGHVNAVGNIISESAMVFRTMEEQMNEIVGIAKQINDISFKLTILSLNASIEAAHAGKSGSGFEVLASEMRELSENSSGFALQVSEVVEELLERVEKTSERFSGSEMALAQSEKTMSKLVDSIEKLHQQFSLLYENIECQNDNVNQVDSIFDNLNQRVLAMHSSSLDNQNAVEEIVDAMIIFKDNVGKIVKNTQSI